MTTSRMLRPVLVLVAGSLVTACSGVDRDARFEHMAQAVADVPVTGAASPALADQGLRPAFAASNGPMPALKVQVMDPHDLWDARDGLAPARSASGLVEAADATVTAGRVSGLRPAFRPQARAPEVAAPEATVAKPVAAPRATIQLGAYSSLEAAQAAWANARSGKARATLNSLTPEFVSVRKDGRTLVRLRVSASATTAAALCRAAEVTDPWCRRGA